MKNTENKLITAIYCSRNESEMDDDDGGVGIGEGRSLTEADDESDTLA